MIGNANSLCWLLQYCQYSQNVWTKYATRLVRINSISLSLRSPKPARHSFLLPYPSSSQSCRIFPILPPPPLSHTRPFNSCPSLNLQFSCPSSSWTPSFSPSCQPPLPIPSRLRQFLHLVPWWSQSRGGGPTLSHASFPMATTTQCT